MTVTLNYKSWINSQIGQIYTESSYELLALFNKSDYAKLNISLWVVYACCMAIPILLENQKERISAVSNEWHVLKSSLVYVKDIWGCQCNR